MIAQYMKKGSGLFVEGRLQTRSYVAKDGSKRYVTEVVVENMQFGPRRTQESAQGATDPGRDDQGYSQERPQHDSRDTTAQPEPPKEDEIDVTDMF